jgi:hypothetical protein
MCRGYVALNLNSTYKYKQWVWFGISHYTMQEKGRVPDRKVGLRWYNRIHDACNRNGNTTSPAACRSGTYKKSLHPAEIESKPFSYFICLFLKYCFFPFRFKGLSCWVLYFDGYLLEQFWIANLRKRNVWRLSLEVLDTCSIHQNIGRT